MPSVSDPVFLSGSGSNFFPESGLAKNLDAIRENPDSQKEVQKLQQQVEQICISYLALSTLSSFFQVPPKPNQKHHLAPISLLKDESGSG